MACAARRPVCSCDRRGASFGVAVTERLHFQGSQRATEKARCALHLAGSGARREAGPASARGSTGASTRRARRVARQLGVGRSLRAGRGRALDLPRGPGTYALAAFEDRNANLVYEPGEPALAVAPDQAITCAAATPVENLDLVIPATGRAPVDGPINIARLQVRSIDDQLSVSLGAVTAVGEVVSLDDPRFSAEHASQGLWRPFDFLFEARPGVYFLEPYSSKKTPVLFVHGINGTPASFHTLIGNLDRSRFQPWVYYYPSGAHLGAVADHLDQTIKRLQLQHGFKRLLLVAYSMGGLVSRGFLLRNQTETRRADIPLFVSISSPWGGVPSAAKA